MSKLKITFRKEIEVDLNNYYPRFSPRLRHEIDDAMFALLGGTHQKTNGNGLHTSTGVAGAVILRRLRKAPSRGNTKIAAALADIDRLTGKEYLKEDVLKICTQHKMAGGSALHNMVKGGYLEVVK